uniref:Acyl_transf_3 domain-containing protein n=1 Tax=Syphacia muris TaxID=451379 RepID=A0A0N5AB81_9BILA
MQTAKQKEKRRDIQGIRGVAIVYVLLFHMFPKQFPHGFLGVDMFFVISGFLITMILRREDELTCSDVMIFFKKRIKRIFPAYYLVLVLIIICGLTTLASSDFRLLKTDTLWAVGFATNFHKYFQGLDYFAQVGLIVANFDFLLHTWSLAVEIQFYVVAPILILMSRHFVGKYFFCSSLFIASVWFNLTATGQLQFSSLPSRIWQFMCGGIAYTYSVAATYILVAIVVHLGQFPSWTVAVPLFIVSPITLLLPLSDTVFRFLVTFASAFIISANNNFLNKYILGNDLLYFIGEISYSVYLFHWPIILFLKYSSNVDELSFKGK